MLVIYLSLLFPASQSKHFLTCIPTLLFNDSNIGKKIYILKKILFRNIKKRGAHSTDATLRYIFGYSVCCAGLMSKVAYFMILAGYSAGLFV